MMSAWTIAPSLPEPVLLVVVINLQLALTKTIIFLAANWLLLEVAKVRAFKLLDF